MLKHIIKVFFITFIAFFSTSLLAQAKWYSVEYIVFEHAATGSSQEPSSRPIQSSTNRALRLLPSNGGTGDWRSFRRLSKEEMSLFGARRSLSTSTRYNPRLHAGWLQQLAAGDQPQPVQVSTGANDMPIRGTITFRRGRFLHLDVDLTLTENPALGRASNNYRSSNETRFHLKQTRRIRTQQLHYFDHPRFGVLVKVMPLAPPVVEAPPETSLQNAESAPNGNKKSDTEIPLPAAETPESKP